MIKNTSMKRPKIGEAAPAFEVKNQHGEIMRLDDFKGKKVVIYFYPKDDTPGCTAQACNIRDNYAAITNKGIVVLGVSADNESKHQKFIIKYDLPFTLLADVDHSMLNAYGVWGEKKFMGRVYDGIHRTTFVLDEDHKIIGIIEKPNTKDHTREVLEIYDK